MTNLNMDNSYPTFTLLKQSNDFLTHSCTIYQPLDPRKREIRVVDLQPGCYEDEQICIDISTVSLEDNPQYEALSYTWEDLTQTKIVKVHGLDYNVTANQWAALKRLRCEPNGRRIWIDVISINQADEEERSHQVSMMADIFACSFQTLVWLGEPTPEDLCGLDETEWQETSESFIRTSDALLLQKVNDTNAALALMDEMLAVMTSNYRIIYGAIHILDLLRAGKHEHQLPFYIVNEKGEVHLVRQWFDALKGLRYLTSRQWWSRVWILQEVALSRSSPTVMIGPLTLALEHLLEAGRLAYQHDISPGCCSGYQFNWGREVSINGDILTAFGPVRFILDAIKSSKLSLHDASTMSCFASATDLRDHIYGILGLVKEVERLPVNYKMSVAEVFAHATIQIASTKTNETSLFAEACCMHYPHLKLPTWSRNFSEDQPDPSSHLITEICSDVGTNYSKTEEYKVPSQVAPGVLEIEGQWLDRLDVVLDPASDDSSLRLQDKLLLGLDTWWEFMRLRADGQDRNTFWRTLLWNFWVTQPEDDTAPQQILKLETDLLTCIRSELGTFCEEDVDVAGHKYRQYTNLYDRAFARCLPFVTKRGCFGSGPVDGQPGDYIFRTKGCPMPLLLRAANDGGVPPEDIPNDGKICFRLVGMCYIENYFGSFCFTELQQSKNVCIRLI